MNERLNQQYKGSECIEGVEGVEGLRYYTSQREIWVLYTIDTLEEGEEVHSQSIASAGRPASVCCHRSDLAVLTGVSTHLAWTCRPDN
jgi:hypothetical protein